MSASPIFLGVSSYAGDLQQVITRSLSIAALPLQQLQNQLQDMNGQASALGTLDDRFSALQAAIGQLDAALGPASYSGASSDNSLAAVSVGAGALESSYSIDISSIGSFTSTISDPSLPSVADPYADSISSSSTFTLTVDGQAFNVTSNGGGLIGLAQAINSSGAGVRASLVNVGTSSAPNYRLVVSASKLGPVAIQLNDGSQDLIDTLSTGTLASYTVNGLPSPVQSDSRTVTLAPGVTVDLLGETPPGQPITISVSRSLDGIRSALSNFADAYNQAVDALQGQIGQNAGPLSGQSIVFSLRQALGSLAQYSSTGNVFSLSAIGLNLGSDGKLTFDQSQFDSDNPNDIETFLGRAADGGFLMAATNAMAAVEDDGSGTLKTAIGAKNAQISRQNELIAAEQQRLSDVQTRLQQQMSAADALIASLESQKNYITNLFTAMMNNNTSGGVKSY